MLVPGRARPRVLILDNHPVVRRGVMEILGERFPPLEIVEGECGQDGLNLMLGQIWDLVIVGVDMPGLGALDILTELTRNRPDQPMLVFTVRMKPADAAGILKSHTTRDVEVANSPEELVSAVSRVLAPGMSGGDDAGHESLSRRECEVLRLLGLGASVKEIAAALTLSEKTVSTYRSRLLVKLRLKTTAELIRYAVMNGLSDRLPR